MRKGSVAQSNDVTLAEMRSNPIRLKVYEIPGFKTPSAIATRSTLPFGRDFLSDKHAVQRKIALARS
jgi:hypothetical protein